MTTYLIDYENTSHHGLDGFKKLTANDTVVIFLGAKNSKSSMPIEVVIDLTALGEKPRLLWERSTKTSKNYLDLQLGSFLGCLIGDSDVVETEYVIVSKDHDFEAVIDLWAKRRRDIHISIQPAIASPKKVAPTRQVKAESKPPSALVSEATKRAVRTAVKNVGLKPSDYSAIYRAFVASKNLQELHTSLSQSLGTQGQEIYRLVKDIYSQL